MKAINSIVFLFLLFGSVLSVAQTDENNSYISKGQWMLGGTISLSTPENFKTPNFTISPRGAYFVQNRIALGVDMTYSLVKLNYEDPYTGEESTRSYSRLSVTPFARYYFGVNKFAPFVEGGYGMGWNYSEGTETSNNQAYNIGAGLNWFLSPSLAVEGKLSYTRSTSETAYINPISLGIGLQFFLSRNQKTAANEKEEAFLERGNWMIGGNIDLSISENEYSDNLYQVHTLTPMVGYFLTDKIATGLTLQYSYYGIYTSSSQGLSAAPFIRYYFSTQRFVPFVEAAFGGGVSRTEFFDGTEQQVIKNENFTYHAATGFNYFITRNIALESRLSYYRNNNNDQGSLSLQGGLQFFLSRKK